MHFDFQIYIFVLKFAFWVSNLHSGVKICILSFKSTFRSWNLNFNVKILILVLKFSFKCWNFLWNSVKSKNLTVLPTDPIPSLSRRPFELVVSASSSRPLEDVRFRGVCVRHPSHRRPLPVRRQQDALGSGPTAQLPKCRPLHRKRLLQKPVRKRRSLPRHGSYLQVRANQTLIRLNSLSSTLHYSINLSFCWNVSTWKSVRRLRVAAEEFFFFLIRILNFNFP